MVHAATALGFAKVVTSSTGGGIEKALYSPKGLYKFLFRQCDKLPNKEVKLYYRHHIRQSYNQHADETDPERVSQIINQAAKDIGWVLKKWRKMESQSDLGRKRKREDSPREVDVITDSLEGVATGPVKFFHALSTYCSRPELLVPHARGTDLDWDILEPEQRLCYKGQTCETLFDYLYSPIYHEGRCVGSANIGEFSGPLQEETILELMKPDCPIKAVRLTRNIQSKRMKEEPCGLSFVVKEHWDFQNCTVEVIPDQNDCMHFPGFPLMTFKAKYSDRGNLVSIIMRVPVHENEAVTNRAAKSIEFYKTNVFPEILKWMSSYEVKSSNLSRLRPRPLTYIPNRLYWNIYDRLKCSSAAVVKTIWNESTDPIKFIHEDVGIASYISAFIFGHGNSLYRTWNDKENVQVLDFGCGNGLLGFFLSQVISHHTEQSRVVGFDIRKRGIWENLLAKGRTRNYFREAGDDGEVSSIRGELDLLERPIVPHMIDDLVEEYYCTDEERKGKSLWIIGNHSDELTPWIPLIARRLNANGFFIIPCCSFDFYGKYQRRGDIPCPSTYHNYIEYVCRIGDDYGYQPTLDKLRIPSTKNICLVGINCGHRFESKVISSRVDSMLRKLKEGDDGSPISKFVPRTVESAKENPKIDRKLAQDIVNKIFSLLIQDWRSFPESVWYAGRDSLTFNDIISNLTESERRMLKGKGNGLRTLIKSNKHVFTLDGNFVKLRKPNENDLQNVSETSRDRINTRTCYFFKNHPQGCPLASELCSYRHEIV